MIDINKLILELEIQTQRQELRKLGLTEEEILASFEFGTWYDEDIIKSPKDADD